MPFIIGVAGSSGSGKTTTSAQLARYFKDRCVVISADNYYFGLDKMTATTFDHPDAIDFPFLVNQVQQLKEGKAIDMPGYDFSVSARKATTTYIEPCEVIIVEGILVLQNEALRQLFDVSIFVDTDIDVCRERRLARDVKERGRTYEHALLQWTKDVMPCYKRFVEPSREHASILIANSSHSDTLEVDISPIIEDLERRVRPRAIVGRYSLFPEMPPAAQNETPTANFKSTSEFKF